MNQCKHGGGGSHQSAYFTKYQLKNTSVLFTMFSCIYWYLFIIAVFASLGYGICNHILADLFFKQGK